MAKMLNQVRDHFNNNRFLFFFFSIDIENLPLWKQRLQDILFQVSSSSEDLRVAATSYSPASFSTLIILSLQSQRSTNAKHNR